MFHKEFYPTPSNVLHLMNLDVRNKIVLEPSAGKGDIVKFCFLNGASRFLTYEINDDLREILKPISEVLGSDFMDSKKEDLAHLDIIVMNPPFSKALEHIVHAWENAPEGCEIVSLCNYDSIDSYEMRQFRGFSNILSNYGDYENLGSCFDTAERKTNVNIGLIRLFKPVVSADFDYDKFLCEDVEEEQQGAEPGMMQYNEVRAIVNRYIGAVKLYDSFFETKEQLNELTKPLRFSSLEINTGSSSRSYNTKRDFSVALQKSAWSTVFEKMKVEKYLTSGLKDKLNRFIEKQSKYPFSMQNVYNVLDLVFQTRSQSLDEALIEVIENFTRHTKENRYNIEGWAHNSSYMLNKYFIIDYATESDNWNKDKVRIKYNGQNDRMTDLMKVLCNVQGYDLNKIITIDDKEVQAFYTPYQFSRVNEGLFTNVWYDCGLFEIKGFKKGTMHVKFKNMQDWFAINEAYGKLKGFQVPESCNPSKVQDMSKKDNSRTTRDWKKPIINSSNN